VGSLRHFHFPEEFVRRFPVFVETGYGDGNGLSYAMTHDFERLYSIEIWPSAAARGRERARLDPRVVIIESNSVMGLQKLYDESAIFFWLDAHYPGADADGEPYDRWYPEAIRFPLNHELDTIRKLWPQGNYFILIDDLRLYADLPWEEGPMIEQSWGAHPPTIRTLDFLWPFTLTHDVQISLNDGGYALIGGRKAPRIRFIA